MGRLLVEVLGLANLMRKLLRMRCQTMLRQQMKDYVGRSAASATNQDAAPRNANRSKGSLCMADNTNRHFQAAATNTGIPL